MSKKNELYYAINVTQNHINICKRNFAAYISDNSYPLCVRWEMFEEAPNFIKNHDSSIHHFEWENKHDEIVWYDDFYVDKYQVVYMDQLIDSMLDKDYTKEMVDDMKEEILSKNLGSFIYDW